jgi:hypothetical protein
VPIRTKAAPLASRGKLTAPVAGSDTLAASTWGAPCAVTNTGVTDPAATAVLSCAPGESTAVLVVVDSAVVLVVVDAAVVLVSAAVVVDAATVVVVDATVVVVVVAQSGLVTVTWPDTTSFGVTEVQRATTTRVADPVEAPNVDVAVADAPGATLLGLSDIANPFTLAESKVMTSPAPVSLLPTVQCTVHSPLLAQFGWPLTKGCQAEATPADSEIEATMAPMATATNPTKRFTADPFGHNHAQCVGGNLCKREEPRLFRCWSRLNTRAGLSHT